MSTIHPLLIAAKENDVVVAEILLKEGADVNVRSSENGVTPLMVASALGHLKMVKLLLEHNPDPSIVHREPSHCDLRALDYAVYNHHTRVASLLRKHAAKVAA